MVRGNGAPAPSPTGTDPGRYTTAPDASARIGSPRECEHASTLPYAVDRDSPWYDPARTWLENQMNGSVRVGLPWQSLTAFLRISTHPRALANPLRAVDAWAYVRAWLDAPTAWAPVATDHHATVLGRLVERYAVTGNLVDDAHLAALAIEYGVAIASADTDFARFTEVDWVNPVRP